MKSSVLFMMLFLSACGYHLRGNTPLPNALQKVYFSDASSALNAAVLKVYQGSSAKLVASASAANVIIKITDESYQRRSISTGNAGYSNEYELHYRFTFALFNPQGKQLLEKQMLEQSKAYYNDQSGSSFISKMNEETLLREELYIAMVRRVLALARSALAQ